MAEAKNIDPYDVEALEKSLNDSATRVSTIWISYLLFGLYLIIAAGNVTHRQILLEEPIKLPVLNVDLPLVGFFFLTPILFVAIHAYVLIQTVLLSRTASAYNEAIAKCDLVDSAEARVRQRLANTLFAQIFAGSPRERSGLLGWLLNVIAWTTLVIAPVLVLFTFELKFLPFHSPQATWGHRGLIVVDLIVVLLLWPGILDSQKDIAWRSLFRHWKSSLLVTCLVLLSIVALTFPGEQHAAFLNTWETSEASSSKCRKPRLLLSILPSNFDRLFLARETLAEAGQPRMKIGTASTASSEAKKALNLRERDLLCATFDGADLTQVDFTDAVLTGATFARAELQGAIFDSTVLTDVSFREAHLQKSSFQKTRLDNANLRKAKLDNANFDGSELNKVDLTQADVRGSKMNRMDFRSVILGATIFNDADLSESNFQGTKIGSSKLQGVNLSKAQLQGADLSRAGFQGATLQGAQLQGAKLDQGEFGGTDLRDARLRGASMRGIRLQGANLDSADLRGADLTEGFLQGASLWYTDLQGTLLEKAQLGLTEIMGAYVWGTTGEFKCENSAALNFEFDLTLETEARSGIFRFLQLGKLLSIVGPSKSSASTGEILDSIANDVPVASRERLRETLGRRLGPVAKPGATAINTKSWTSCSGKAQTNNDLAQKRATYLASVVCGAAADQRQISSGIYRTILTRPPIFLFRSSETGPHFARGLITAGKFCPGADGLDDKMKDRLREMASSSPTK